jgi:parvulin-like peptidyl-prolyl isomerase
MKRIALALCLILSVSAFAQTDAKSPAAVSKDIITNSQELSKDQKDKLLALQEETMKKISEVKAEIEKNKLTLVQTALEPKMDKKMYRDLKKKITKLEKERVELGFKAIDKARDIIDPTATNQARTFNKAFINTHLIEF